MEREPQLNCCFGTYRLYIGKGNHSISDHRGQNDPLPAIEMESVSLEKRRFRVHRGETSLYSTDLYNNNNTKKTM